MSREETETVITWTLADDKATVYTLMPRIAQRCRRAGGVEIRKDEGIRSGRKVAWTFLVDPKYISIRSERKELSPEQLAKAQEHGRNFLKRTTKVGVPDPNSPGVIPRGGS